MKSRNFSWFVWKELRASWPWYLFSTFLLTVLLLTISVIYSSIYNTIGAFYDYLNILNSDGLVVELRGLHYSNVNQISDFGMKEIYIDTDYSFVNHLDLFAFGEKIDTDEYNVKLEYNRGLLQHEVIRGRSFTMEDNETRAVWISEEMANRYNLDVGDIIEHVFQSTGMTYEYEVYGVFDQYIERYSILMPFLPYYQTSQDNGRYVDHIVYGVIGDSHDASGIYSQLKRVDIVPVSQYDDILQMMDMISTLLYILMFVMSIFVGWTFSNVIHVILKRRIKSLLQYRMLGMNQKYIHTIYLIFILGMMIISISISLILSGFYAGYIRGLVEQTLHIVVHVKQGKGLLLAESFSGILITIVAIARVIRMISNMNIMELIEEQNS